MAAANEHEMFTLKDVVASRHSLKGIRQAFSLIFHGSRIDVMVDQQMVPLRHAALGDMVIFMGPIARNDDGTMRYQAVFN